MLSTSRGDSERAAAPGPSAHSPAAIPRSSATRVPEICFGGADKAEKSRPSPSACLDSRFSRQLNVDSPSGGKFTLNPWRRGKNEKKLGRRKDPAVEAVEGNDDLFLFKSHVLHRSTLLRIYGKICVSIIKGLLPHFQAKGWLHPQTPPCFCPLQIIFKVQLNVSFSRRL